MDVDYIGKVVLCDKYIFKPEKIVDSYEENGKIFVVLENEDAMIIDYINIFDDLEHAWNIYCKFIEEVTGKIPKRKLFEKRCFQSKLSSNDDFKSSFSNSNMDIEDFIKESENQSESDDTNTEDGNDDQNITRSVRRNLINRKKSRKNRK